MATLVFCYAGEHSGDTGNERTCLRAGPDEVLRCALIVMNCTAEQGEDAFNMQCPTFLLRMLSRVFLCGSSTGQFRGLVGLADLLHSLARLTKSLFDLVVSHQ